MKSYLLFIVLCELYQAISALTFPNIDYYWRDYNGIIPVDAVPGGLDLNNETTYIGQGYVKERGIIPGIIYKGKNEIVAPSYGTNKIDTYIKILCGPDPSAFSWIEATDKTFHTKMINKFPVKGGIEEGYIVNIGRVAYQGQTVTGKIATNWPEKATMYFAYKDQEKSISSYEVLVYGNKIQPNFSHDLIVN